MAQKKNKPAIEFDYLTLLKENNDLKKTVNQHETNLKRVSTKLLKMLHDKSKDVGMKSFDMQGNSEELLQKVSLLEQENYNLKDKNTVLRQQLFEHTKQMQTLHCSPSRKYSSSPRICRPYSVTSMDRSTTHNDGIIQNDETTRSSLQEVQHLRHKVSVLEEELSRNVSINRKMQIEENIELCFLMRKCKQYEITIKSQEERENKLKADFAELKLDNDTIQAELLSKEKELLDLSLKLDEEKSFSILSKELQERIKDLQTERDALNDRCALLLKNINEKTVEINNLLGIKKIVQEHNLSEANARKSKNKKCRNISAQTESMGNGLTLTEVYHRHTQTEEFSVNNGKEVPSADELRLRNEVDMLKNMLSVQTQRCRILQDEVVNYRREVKKKDQAANDLTLQRDLFLKLIEKANIKLDTSPEPIPKEFSRAASPAVSIGSGNTYTKNGGTYTKSSPVKSPKQFPINANVTVLDSSNDKNEINGSNPTPPVAVPRTSKLNSRLNHLEEPSSIKIKILWLQLKETSEIYQNPEVNLLYVDFTFFGMANDDFETPIALPKPEDVQHKIEYNYSASVILDDGIKTKIPLAKPEEYILIFNINSEPSTDADEVECVTVGICKLTLNDLMNYQGSDNNIILPVTSLKDASNVSGHLAVEFYNLDTLIKCKTADHRT